VCLDVINQTWSPMYELLNVFEVGPAACLRLRVLRCCSVVSDRLAGPTHTRLQPPTHPLTRLTNCGSLPPTRWQTFLPQLLVYPNPADPLNGEAAALLMNGPEDYEKRVRGECTPLVSFWGGACFAALDSCTAVLIES
jgi:hypothetical protein